MAKLFYFVCVAVCLQIVSCRVVRDTQVQPPTLSDLAKQAETVVSDFHNKFLEFVGVQNDNELVTLVNQKREEYAGKLKGLISELTAETGKADEVFKGITARLNTAVEELKVKDPQLNTNVQKLEEELKSTLQTVLKETDEYAKKAKEQGEKLSESVEGVLKLIIDNTVETAKKVATDIETVVKEKKN